MSDPNPSTQTTPENDDTVGQSQLQTGNDTNRQNSSTQPRATIRPRDNHTNSVVSSTHRDFAGDTPGIGGVLALRNENVSLKKNYDKFCDKLRTYVMKELKNGEHVVQIIENPEADVKASYEKTYKPKDLTTKEKDSVVEVEIKKKKEKSM